MAASQMPSGTHRRGQGSRPYSSYVIFRLDKDDKEVQLGLTHRITTEDGKTKWQGDNGKEKSGLVLVHRDAVEWLLGSKPKAPAAPKKAPEKDSAAPEKGTAPAPKSELTKQLAKTVS